MVMSPEQVDKLADSPSLDWGQAQNLIATIRAAWSDLRVRNKVLDQREARIRELETCISCLVHEQAQTAAEKVKAEVTARGLSITCEELQRSRAAVIELLDAERVDHVRRLQDIDESRALAEKNLAAAEQEQARLAAVGEVNARTLVERDTYIARLVNERAQARTREADDIITAQAEFRLQKKLIDELLHQHEHDAQTNRDNIEHILRLERQGRAPSDTELLRWRDFATQLAVLYPQAARESGATDPSAAGQLRPYSLARWLAAHVPADIARLRKHSQALRELLIRQAPLAFEPDSRSSTPLTKTLWVLLAQQYEASLADPAFLDNVVDAILSTNTGV